MTRTELIKAIKEVSEVKGLSKMKKEELEKVYAEITAHAQEAEATQADSNNEEQQNTQPEQAQDETGADQNQKKAPEAEQEEVKTRRKATEDKQKITANWTTKVSVDLETKELVYSSSVNMKELAKVNNARESREQEINAELSANLYKLRLDENQSKLNKVKKSINDTNKAIDAEQNNEKGADVKKLAKLQSKKKQLEAKADLIRRNMEYMKEDAEKEQININLYNDSTFSYIEALWLTGQGLKTDKLAECKESVEAIRTRFTTILKDYCESVQNKKQLTVKFDEETFSAFQKAIEEISKALQIYFNGNDNYKCKTLSKKIKFTDLVFFGQRGYNDNGKSIYINTIVNDKEKNDGDQNFAKDLVKFAMYINGITVVDGVAEN